MNSKLRITNCKLLIANVFWFVFAVLVAVVLLEQNALLGFAAALVGGIVFGALGARAREAKT